MLSTRFYFFIFFMLFTTLTFADGGKKIKELYATRITTPPKIDGVLDEDVWVQTRCVATNFVQRDPDPGGFPTAPTEVKILYDNNSIYVGATLYDISADSIMREFTRRDDIGFSDVFGVYFDTYNDGINAFEFMVTAAGGQFDRRWTSMGNDRSWNAAWYSEVKIDSANWYVEMEIPLSALRFPKKPIQQWGVNFRRTIRRNNEHNYWNEINPEVDGFVNQFGNMSGVANLKSPIRLSISPYLSTYLNNYSGDQNNPASTSNHINGGMDIRYGINDAFTLDMILVPDFGQVVSDNKVLNLSPFEVQYNENRQFFKEGTELFDKGGFFYSRRVGGQPLLFNTVEKQLEGKEEIIANPSESSLINASKVSGRTNSGLGLGIFNGITRQMTATVQNTETGEKRDVLTSPLTNYNVLAIDQSLKNNSYISFINTNVMRQGSYYDANLTGTTFRFTNPGNTFAVSGKGAVSQKYGMEDGNQFGYTSSLSIAKTGGNLRASIRNSIESDTYDPNDLGYMRANNSFNTYANIGYNIYKPFWQLLNLYTDFDASYSRLYNPFTYTNFYLSASARGTFRNYFYLSLNYSTTPFERYDYFEPRVEGRYFVTPSYNSVNLYFRTDSRKRLTLGTSFGYTDYNFDGKKSTWLGINPQLRVNNKLSFSGSVNYNTHQNSLGFARKSADNSIITFGRRDINTFNNVFNTKFTFNNKMDLSFRMRHYWRSVEYKEFYTLGQAGDLLNSSYDGNHDRNYNAFNIDMVYSYVFAPASEISIVWKNSISSDYDFVMDDYMANIQNLKSMPQSNSISIRLLYFIDYSMMMKKFSKPDYGT